MKTQIFIIFISLWVLSCNKQQVGQMGKSSANDTLALKMAQKDSSIMEYIKSINMIHSSIDSLSRDAKILKMHGESPITSTASMVDEIRAIDKLMIKNNKSLADLKMKLNKSNIKNQELVDLGEALSLELNEKDSEIVSIQKELSRTKASLTDVTKQLNDSVNVIAKQRAAMAVMKTEGDKVYYIAGTEEELKKKGIIANEGGVIGLGRIPVVNQNISQAGFTAIDFHELKDLPLHGRFVKLVTTHPLSSYRIATGSEDKLIITDPEDFWSKSKYMVAIVR